MFYCYWGKENRLLYQGLRYIEVHYIMVSLNLDDGAIYGLPHTWSITHISHFSSHFTWQLTVQPTQNLYFLLPLDKPQANANHSPLIRTISQFLSFLEERWWILA